MTVDQLIAELQKLKEEEKIQGIDGVVLEVKERPYAKRLCDELLSIKRNHMMDGSYTILLSSIQEGFVLGGSLANFESILLWEDSCN